MQFKAVSLSLVAGCVLSLHAGWPAIGPEIWAMKEDPAQGIVGAVVLQNKMAFTGTAIKHEVRFRILSERGKSVAELPVFLPEARKIEGRTVQPDGTVTTFDKAKDFNEKTISIGDTERDTKVILPPGLTANCVVELRWEEIVLMGGQTEIPDSLGDSAEWRMGSSFLTKEQTVEFWANFHMSARVSPGTIKYPEVTKTGRTTVYKFTDIPPLEPSPYALDSISGRPTVMVWQQPPLLAEMARAKPDEYWLEAARMFFKTYYFKDLKRGRAYEALSKELIAGLPPEPDKAAEMLCRRLDRRIMNQSWATFEEKAKLKKDETLDKIKFQDLNAAVTDGRTSGIGMTMLFMSLAMDAGLHPRMGFMRDRTNHLFHYQLPDVYQLEDILVGIPVGPERTVWVDPSLRFATPGLVLPMYQGFDALSIDTETWVPRAAFVPTQPSEFNQSHFQCKIAFSEGEESFAMKAGFTGYKEYQERRKYLALSQQEAERKLRETMEKAVKDATISRVAVTDIWNPDKNAGWEVDGKIELASAGTLRVAPFPGMPAPLWFPTNWPEHRTVPIVMDYLRIQDATCEVRIPAGYALQAMPDLQKQNRFGRVFYTVATRPDGDASVATVNLKVEVTTFNGNATSEPSLKQFLTWAEEAYHREIVLEKR